LTGVEVLRSPLTGTRVIVEVIFAYTNRNTDFTEKFCVRVDVTEEFPVPRHEDVAVLQPMR
jgi:hypothetical protein